MNKKIATITIGRNIESRPMSTRDWIAFKSEVKSLFDVVFVEAEHRGEWQGVAELSAVFVGQLSVANPEVVAAKLAVLARQFKQDAIGYMVNERHDSLVRKAA